MYPKNSILLLLLFPLSLWASDPIGIFQAAHGSDVKSYASPSTQKPKKEKIPAETDLELLELWSADSREDENIWAKIRYRRADSWVRVPSGSILQFTNPIPYSFDSSLFGPVTQIDKTHAEIYLLSGGISLLQSIELGSYIRTRFGIWKRTSSDRVEIRFRIREDLTDNCMAISEEGVGSNGLPAEKIKAYLKRERRICEREAEADYGKKEMHSVLILHLQGPRESYSVSMSGDCDPKPVAGKERYCLPIGIEEMKPTNP